MIENNDRVKSLLNNILNNVIIIKNDFDENNETHYDYVLEKLQSAQWDLNIMIDIARAKELEDKDTGK